MAPWVKALVVKPDVGGLVCMIEVKSHPHTLSSDPRHTHTINKNIGNGSWQAKETLGDLASLFLSYAFR